MICRLHSTTVVLLKRYYVLQSFSHLKCFPCFWPYPLQQLITKLSFLSVTLPLQTKQNLQRPTPDLLICLQFLDDSLVKLIKLFLIWSFEKYSTKQKVMSSRVSRQSFIVNFQNPYFFRHQLAGPNCRRKFGFEYSRICR